MAGLRHFVVLGTCALLVACSAPAVQAPADTTADAAALDGFQKAWASGYNAGDAAAVVALYTDDATLNPPGAPVAKGHAAMQDYFTKDIAGSKAAGITMNISAPTDRAISGDAAWETGTWTATDKSVATADMGKCVTAFRRMDGKWLIAADIWNSDKAPAPPPPAEPTK